jgi:hypothetical protein
LASGFHKFRKREARRLVRERDSARMRELRHRITGLRARRRAALQEVRSTCRAERERVRAEARAIRAATLERLRASLAELRAAQRGTCEDTKREARAALTSELARALDERQTERQRQASEAELDASERRRLRAAIRTTAKERKQESDDEVRGNIPPELVSVFDKIRTKIKGSSRTSRTEAFLQFAEENPGEVLTMQQEAGERKFLRELREHEAELRKMQRRRRPLRDPQALAEALAEVPF